MTTNDELQSNTPPTIRSYWKWIRLIPALILISAAIGKIWFAPQLLMGGGLLSSKTLLFGAVFLEIASGMVILTCSDRLSWWTGVMVYGMLACFATYSLLTGKSCNCFGTSIGSNVTLPLDLSVLFVCWIARPLRGQVAAAMTPAVSGQEASISSSQMSRVLGAIVLGLASTAWVWIRVSQVATNPTIAFLMADAHIGKPWPVGETLHPDLKALKEGKWLVLLVREDCEHCRELVSKHFADPSPYVRERQIVTFVSAKGAWDIWFSKVSFERSNQQIEWKGDEPFFASPAIFLLEDGIVKAAADGDEAEAFVIDLQQ